MELPRRGAFPKPHFGNEVKSLLEPAIAIAVLAHKGTVDKAGQPYLLHLRRLMMRVETETEKIRGGAA